MPPASGTYIMTVATVALGRSIRDQEVINPKTVTAFVLILLTLGFLNSIDPGFAGAMSLLIFVAVFLTYGPEIMSYVGFNLQTEDN
jgi:hypothetical protein